MNRVQDAATAPSCQTAACASRREFMRSAGCVGIGIALLGASVPEARGLAASFIEGTQSGDDRRYPIPAADGVTIDRSAQLIVARAQGHVFVFALSCPHQNNAVKWLPNDHRFQCTKHDSQYQVDGLHTAGRATRNLDRYVIRRDGEAVVVDMHRWIQSDKDPVGWAAATIAV
ncbi:MAG: Rieske 2Fe-2S domain-containing protein [Acidobacteriota bacterium]